MTQEERDEEWNFMDSVKKTVEKKEKKEPQFNIVMSEEKEKIVIKDKKISPQKTLPLGPVKEIKPVNAPYKSVTKDEDVDWDEWKDEKQNKDDEEEQGEEWNTNWGEKKSNPKFTPVQTQLTEKSIQNKAKFIGLGSQDSGDLDKLQKETLKKKKREANANFLELSNEAKIDYLKESAKELGQKTVEVSGVVYEKVSEVGEQVGEVVSKWWSGLMQN